MTVILRTDSINNNLFFLAIISPVQRAFFKFCHQKIVDIVHAITFSLMHKAVYRLCEARNVKPFFASSPIVIRSAPGIADYKVLPTPRSRRPLYVTKLFHSRCMVLRVLEKFGDTMRACYVPYAAMVMHPIYSLRQLSVRVCPNRS